jgi:endonuclease/exonuclease/phosphatase family metal-dependent hydrolase
LQELDFRRDANMLDFLRDETGFHAVAAITFRRGDGAFGNGLLSRFPIVSHETIDLSVAGREPRNAIDAIIDCDGIALRVIATHLGLQPIERIEQARRLLTALTGHRTGSQMLAGDINEWALPRHALSVLHAHFGESTARATFPSLCPLFALDRLWSSPQTTLTNVRAHKRRAARIASDHLPLVAELHLDTSA